MENEKDQTIDMFEIKTLWFPMPEFQYDQNWKMRKTENITKKTTT
jgi:hypothetical protein